MLADEPEDQFLRYALAMELEKAGEHQRSLELLRGLMNDTQRHVPAYFMAGQHLANQDRIEEAREVLSAGINEAHRQGDTHAGAEMREFLANLDSSI